MKSESLIGLAAVITALHVIGLSMLLGLRHVGYTLAATLSAPLIWGGVLFLKGGKRPGKQVAGVIIGLTVQQVAHQAWKAELPGFWWPLAQFAAVQFVIAYGLWRCVK